MANRYPPASHAARVKGSTLTPPRETIHSSSHLTKGLLLSKATEPPLISMNYFVPVRGQMWVQAEMIAKDEAEWSQEMFGDCELGGARRTQRLVNVGTLMAGRMGDSLAKSCEGDAAALLGSYRLLRNDGVEPQAIREGGFANVAKHAQAYKVLLAVEDTTSVSYTHAVAASLGSTSNQKEAKRQGFLVHSVLLLDAGGRKYGGSDRAEPLV